jgi:hypothetical protein
MQPVRGRLDEEFSRPLEVLHTVAAVLLTRPAISGCLNFWRANSLADSDVDSSGDYQKLSSVA